MEQFAFREFMNKEVVQKTIIFADAFNLTIDGWRSVSTNEHPYRINFYNKGMLVGYIDLTTYDVGSSRYTTSDMPFTLFTPMGKIEGRYDSHFEEFVYDIQNRKDAFEKIDGIFKLKGNNRNNEEYNIYSYITLININGERIRINFNRIASNYEVEIVKSGNNAEETIRLYINSEYISLRHICIPGFNKEIEFANIKIDLLSKTTSHIGTFNFLGKEIYEKIFEVEYDESSIYLLWWQILEQINYSDISCEIEENDPRMFEFIEEIRRELTLFANGITPVCIYDKMARICFFKAKDKFKLDLTRSRDTKTALTENPVLKRIRKK